MRLSDIQGLKPDEVIEYIRKSRSDDPDLEVAEVLQKHEKLLDDFTERNFGFIVPEQNKYKEVASSETIEGRSEMLKLLHSIENPRIKAVIVVEPQRLTRGDLEDIGRITKLFKHTNTKILTPTFSYDLSDDYDKDSFERELKRGNEYLEYFKKIQSRGRLLSVQAGNYIGSKPPYGYKVDWIQEGKKKCPVLVPDEVEADVVKLIFDMYVNQGLKETTIARKLDALNIKTRYGKPWFYATIKRMLTNVHYIGKTKWNYRKTTTFVKDMQIINSRPVAKPGEYLVYEGKHEAIIDEETFRKAGEIMGTCSREKPSTELKNPFASILYCQCGYLMSLRPPKKKDGIYADAYRFKCNNQVHCKTPSVIYDKLLNAVSDSLKQSIEDFNVIIKNSDNQSEVDNHKAIIKNLESKKIELEEKEIAQWELQADPDPTKRMPQHIFIKLNEKLQKDKKEVMDALEIAYSTAPQKIDYTEKIIKFSEAMDALKDPNISGKAKNNLMKQIIKKIEYKSEPRKRMSKEEAKEKGITLQHGGWPSHTFTIDIHLKE